MRAKTTWYVAAVSVAAALSAAAVYLWAPTTAGAGLIDVVLLGALAFIGEGLTFLLPRSSTGSMAFIPYLALAIIAPNWQSVVAVAVVRAAVEFRSRREVIKQVFNTSAHVLMETSAILVYVLCRGTSMLTIPDVTHVAHVTRVVGGAALVATVVGLLFNNMLVVGAVAISTGKSPKHIWLENHRATIGVDVLAAPLVFVFAWVYAAFGVIFAATLWIPILGLRQLQRVNLELEQTNQELLELMVKSLEARDPYTSGHSRRVQHYSTIIARAIGLEERLVEQTGRAALLHDVGKIHEKYASVLAKSENLSPEEWALIQEHVIDGASLVSTMTRLADIVPAVRHHHENWDGTGYPDGLTGEQIPMASRIIRFADTIDAMTTERPYRLPLTEAQVRLEIVRGRATQFDPMIADRLLTSPLWSLLFASSRTGAELQLGRRDAPRMLRVQNDRKRDKSAIMA